MKIAVFLTIVLLAIEAPLIIDLQSVMKGSSSSASIACFHILLRCVHHTPSDRFLFTGVCG